MIKGYRILAMIPARGGSKGIKDKNIFPLNGKPLITYTIEAAKKSRYIDEIIVSTDSKKIADIASQVGANVPFMRPSEIAQDKSQIIDSAIYTINFMKQNNKEYDIFVLLQPTQPLRTYDDIDRAIEIFFEDIDKRDLVSISEVDDHPILIRQIDENGSVKKLIDTNSTVRRQDMPTYYRVNGCIYINWIGKINIDTSFNDNELPYIMPKERSVDIDELSDLAVAEFHLKRRN